MGRSCRRLRLCAACRLPFIVGVPKHEDELIIPAVEGTRRVVEAAIKEGIKKLVLTSAAPPSPRPIPAKPISAKMIDRCGACPNPGLLQKQNIGRQKAWDLIGTQSTTKLAVINPAGVIGPTLSDDIGTANELSANY